jgi:TonB family protein
MLIFRLLIPLVLTCLFILGCEQEGSVKFEDCREKVFLKTNNEAPPIQHLLRTFTCSYQKTTDGKHIIGGVCVAVVNALFHAECLTAYIYVRGSDIKCMENAHVEEDGKCHCNHGYTYNEYATTVAGQCVQITERAGSDPEGQLRTQQARQETTATKTATEAQLRTYQAELQAKITNAWNIPPQSKDLHAEVFLIIDRAGHVEQSRIVQGSGNASFDESLQRAIKQAQPLPTLPEDYAAPSVRVTLHFQGRGAK